MGQYSYQALHDKGLIREMSGKVLNTRHNHDEKVHYVAPKGISSVVQYFLGDTNVEYNRRVMSVNKVLDGWKVTDTEGESETFDAIVMTIPSMQVLELEGGVNSIMTPSGIEIREKLQQVKYSSRWALGFYYPYEAWHAVEDLDWSARYVTRGEDDALVWLSVESKKLGIDKPTEGDNCGPVLVAHAGVPWSLENFENSADSILNDILPRVHKFVPSLSNISPLETKVIRWKYSQVVAGSNVGTFLENNAAVNVGDASSGVPPFVLAGDSIAGSNYENCLRSGLEAAELIKSAFCNPSAAM